MEQTQVREGGAGGAWIGVVLVVGLLLVVFHLKGRDMPPPLTAEQRAICGAMLATADADRAPEYCR